MRDVLAGALWLVVLVLVALFVGVPVGIMAMLHIKREDWAMKIKRLLGGLFVAIAIAAAMAKTAPAPAAPAVMLDCARGFIWVCW